MAGTTMWLNEINYFSGAPNQDFVEVAIPVDGRYMPAFSIAVYDAAGNLQQLLSKAADPLSPNGLQYYKFEGLEFPDTGVAFALIRDDGFVRQFLSFGTGGTVTAVDGPAAGMTSGAILLSDTNPIRGIGLVGSASGPDGWSWAANVATVAGGRRNPGQTHEPSSFTGVEAFGTAANNTMSGTTVGDILSALGGNDTLFGLAGNDVLNGGDGNDTLSGGSGADVHDGGDGTDQASYLSSVAAVTINLETGVHTSDAAGDTFISIENFRLTKNDDTFTMNDDGIVGSVNLDGGNDTFNGGSAADLVYGGLGNDTLNGGGGADRLFGQAGDDTVNGGDGNDTIRGDVGEDTLNGDAGNDFIYGGAHDDTIDGGDDDDRLYGEAGNDTIYGGAGKDTLVGGDGDDDLFGGDGNDNFFGNAGADVYVGGLGNDVMVTTADGAVDTFVFDPNVDEGLDTINGFEVGVDILDWGAETEYTFNETARWTQITLESGTIIRVLGVDADDLGLTPLA